jgi:predicted CoA-binding protein
MNSMSTSIRYLDGPMADGPVPLLDADGAMDVLRDAQRIAIVGASSSPWRASNSVMRYLMDHGYECVPVNPNERTVLGQACFPTLEAAIAGTGGQPFDIVDVFRRAEFTPDIARSAVATGCGMLWLQQLVINWQAATIAHDGGLGVVMDRCSAVEHRRMRALTAG